MTVFTTPGFYLAYVKKEDVKEYLKCLHKAQGLVPFFASIAIAVVELMVRPRLNVLFVDFSVDLPAWVQYANYIAWGMVIALLFLSVKPLVTEPHLSKVNMFLRRYKKSEMVNTRKLMSAAGLQKQALYAFLLVISMVLFQIFTIILPIYRIAGAS